MTYRLNPRPEPLLSPADEVALAKRIAAGVAAEARISDGEADETDRAAVAAGRRARRRFIEANLRLVISIAARTRIPAHVDRDDLIQDGMIGLDRAVDKFDWRKGYRFSTYATWWIRQAIQRGLERTAGTITIPAHRSSELRTALAGVEGDPSRLPSPLAAVAALTHLDSLDRPLGDGDATVADLAAADTAGPDTEVEESTERRAVRSLLDTLDPVTAELVAARFGLDGAEPATFTAIASERGVSAEAVRRRINRALARLRPDALHLVSEDAGASTMPAHGATAAAGLQPAA